MEEKNGSVPGSPANTETDPLGSEHPEKATSEEMSAGGGGGSVSTGTDLVVKRKRGRPRKYVVAADVAGHVSSSPVPAEISSSAARAFSESNLKRGRGRPRGSGKLQLLASLGGFAADTAGGNFTPHVVNVQSGEDVYSKIISFSQKGPRAVCILSATGVVSSVVIRQPGSSGGFLRYEA
ncbi:hypothetical protein FNV43_RR05565 [Rhamnella rubrinervis]|uniref:AT-hook motif nuclear-localized protein n=1 Tax=Rhamnella rubrinervis TaxID=2594499 RepID=A0A8K0HLL3_9ROSA|nr:hypothetical protein FNV43_RR05565 [Rhamnella rubrinervis]